MSKKTHIAYVVTMEFMSMLASKVDRALDKAKCSVVVDKYLADLPDVERPINNVDELDALLGDVNKAIRQLQTKQIGVQLTDEESFAVSIMLMERLSQYHVTIEQLIYDNGLIERRETAETHS